MSRESEIQKQVLAYLQGAEIFHWRNNSGVMHVGRRHITFGLIGSPDIICVIQGQFVGIEVKDEGSQSDKQKHFQSKLEAAGGKYLLVRSLDEVIDGLK